MKIVMITGSPHRHGTSALLADAFIQGAQEAGHTVFRFDAAFQELHPCRACERCHNTDKGCIYKDGMEELNPHICWRPTWWPLPLRFITMTGAPS